jgi:hypothetical protein
MVSPLTITVDNRGNQIGANIMITITGKVLNNTDKPIDVNEINKGVQDELKRLLDNKSVAATPDFKWNITVKSNFTTVSNMDQVNPSDHLIAIVDEVTGGGLSDNIGIALVGGKIAYIEAAGHSSFGCNHNWTPNYSQMVTVSVHEFLHNMGLIDMYKLPPEEQIEGNYMMSYDQRIAKPTLTNDQIKQIVQAAQNIGQNFSYPSHKTTNNWFDTSNEDPEKKSTKGKDKKIPRIVNP